MPYRYYHIEGSDKKDAAPSGSDLDRQGFDAKRAPAEFVGMVVVGP